MNARSSQKSEDASVSKPWFETKDLLMLLLSALIGVLSAVATETVKSRYALDQSKFERRLTAVKEFASAVNLHLNESSHYLEAMADLIDETEFQVSRPNMTPDATRKVLIDHAQESDRIQNDHANEERKQALSIEQHLLTLHALFGGEEPDFGNLNGSDALTEKLQAVSKRMREARKNAQTLEQHVQIVRDSSAELRPLLLEVRKTLDTVRADFNKGLLEFTRKLAKSN